MAELPRLLLCVFDVIPAASGLSRRLTEYLTAFQDRFDVSVLALKSPDHPHIEKYRGARLMRVPVGDKDLASRILAFDRAVRRQLESEEYALVHFTDPFGGYALCETRGDYGHKVIYEAQAFPSQELKHTTPAVSLDRRFLNRVRRQELFCLMNADAVITGTNVTRDFIHSLGVPQETVRVLRQPVDLAPYDAAALGTPDSEPMRALYLGSAWAWQGVRTLVDAARWAADEAELTITIAGSYSPEVMEELSERVENLKLQQVITLLPAPNPEELFKLVAACDIGLAPLDPVDRNTHQGGPLAKVAEYFAGGRAVLAADLPLAHEVVSDEAGVFFEAGNARALAAELVRLANDKDGRKRLGRRARVIAEQRHDSKRIQKQLLELYGSLLGAKLSEQQEARAGGDRGSSPGTPVNGADSGRRRKRGDKTDPAIRMKKQDEPTTDPGKSDPSDRRVEPPTDPAKTVPTPIVVTPFPPSAPPPPATDDVRTDRAEPVLGKPPPSVVPDSFVGFAPMGPLLTSSERPPLPEPPQQEAGRADDAPVPPPASVPPAQSPPNTPAGAPSDAADEPAEISDDEVMEADADSDDDAEVMQPAAKTDDAEPGDASDLAEPADDDEPEAISDEEIAEIDDAPPAGQAGLTADQVEDAHQLTRLNPWFAQLVYGHCPPEGTKFVRPTPPTNFPGRQAAPPTDAAPAPTLRPKAEK